MHTLHVNAEAIRNRTKSAFRDLMIFFGHVADEVISLDFAKNALLGADVALSSKELLNIGARGIEDGGEVSGRHLD